MDRANFISAANKKGVFEAIRKVQDNIDKINEEVYNVDIAANKASHMVDAIEAKYGLYDKEGDKYLKLQKSELLTDMHILEDYIGQALEAVRNISTEVLGYE